MSNVLAFNGNLVGGTITGTANTITYGAQQLTSQTVQAQLQLTTYQKVEMHQCLKQYLEVIHDLQMRGALLTFMIGPKLQQSQHIQRVMQDLKRIETSISDGTTVTATVRGVIFKATGTEVRIGVSGVGRSVVDAVPAFFKICDG